MIKNKQAEVKAIKKVVEMLDNYTMPSALGEDICDEYCALVGKLAKQMNLLPNYDEQGNLIENNSNLTDFDIEVLYEKAGRLAHLFGFVKNRGFSFYKGSDETDKYIQFSVDWLVRYQKSVDEIMDSDILEVNDKNEMDNANSFSVSKLDDADREFIELSYDEETPKKKDAINILEQNDKKQVNENTKKNFPANIQKLFSAMNINKAVILKRWKTLLFEEGETRDFIKVGETYNKDAEEKQKENSPEPQKKADFKKAYTRFQTNVIKRYLGGNLKNFITSDDNDATDADRKYQAKTISDFVLKFSKVWRKQKYAEAIHKVSSFKKRVDSYVRKPGGLHEHLRTCMHSDYATNEKWGMDGPILVLLLKKLVQATDVVAVEVPYVNQDGDDAILTLRHLDAYGSAKYKYNKDFDKADKRKKEIEKNAKWEENAVLKDEHGKLEKMLQAWDTGCKNLRTLHDSLEEKIKESRTVGEVMEKVKKIVMNNSDIKITETCTKNFKLIFNSLLTNKQIS